MQNSFGQIPKMLPKQDWDHTYQQIHRYSELVCNLFLYEGILEVLQNWSNRIKTIKQMLNYEDQGKFRKCFLLLVLLDFRSLFENWSQIASWSWKVGQDYCCQVATLQSENQKKIKYNSNTRSWQSTRKVQFIKHSELIATLR